MRSRTAPRTVRTPPLSSATRTALRASGTKPAASYVKESTLGYCAASLTEARAALLQARLGAAVTAAKPDKSASGAKKKKKPAADGAAQ